MTQISLRQRNFLICLSLAVITVAAYWPVRHFDLISYDDSVYLTKNKHVQSGLTSGELRWAFTTPLDQWMPVTWLIRMLECQLFGLNGGMLHSVNVLFHIANTVLLFGVLRRMTQAPWRSAFVAALFALHPLHVESVAWVTGLKDLLSAFFLLLTIGAYVRYTERLTTYGSWFMVHGSEGQARPEGLQGKPPIAAHVSAIASSAKVDRSTLRQAQGRSPIAFYALTLFFFALALMSKPMVVTLPFVLLLLDFWPLERTKLWKAASGKSMETRLSRLLLEKLPFFVLAAVASVVTLRAQGGARMVVTVKTLSLGMRIANAALAYVSYIIKTVWPTKLAAFYPLELNLSLISATAAGAVLVAVTAVAIWGARRWPWFVTGWLWYLGTLVPVIGLVQVGNQSMADRYTYVPLIGLLIMVAWAVPPGVLERRERKVAAAATIAVLLGACAGLSRLQVGYWKSAGELFQHALEVTHNNWMAHNACGLTMLEAGQVPEAISQYEQALRIAPDYAEAHNNLGVALQRVGRLVEASAQYEQAARLKPHYFEAHYNLGRVLVRLENLQAAIVQYEQAARLKPDAADVQNDLGTILQRAGRVTEAIDHYQQVLRIKPDSVEAHNNLAVALQQTGKVTEAIKHYEQALRLKPDSAESHNNLAVALQQAGRVPEAIVQYQQALRLKPDYAEVRNKLGNALLQTGRLKEAVAQYQEALRIKPDLAETQNNLAWLLATLPPADGGDPARAVTLAERVCQLSGEKDPSQLDTLAVAYAATGRFAEAIATSQKAITLARGAGQTELLKELEVRLQLYRDGHPYQQNP